MTIQEFSKLYPSNHKPSKIAPNLYKIDTVKCQAQHDYETTYNGVTHSSRGFQGLE